MKEKHVRQLLQEQINIYLNNIAIDLESSHDKWFEDFGFPMFGTTAKEYHEQVYFQSYLESYTRKLMRLQHDRMIHFMKFFEESLGIPSKDSYI